MRIVRAAAGALSFVLAAAAGAQPAEPPQPCTGAAYELALRFAGSWQEFALTDTGEELGGRLDTTLEAGGCAISQLFAGADGAFGFRSLGYVEPGTGQWVETYVLSNGRVASYRWRTDGDDVVIDRISGGDPGVRRRLRVTFLDPDTYRVVEETSPQVAEEWTPGIVTMTRRMDAAE
jgi:hypothetical protein